MPAPDRPATISVDFSGVEIRKSGGSDHVPEGDYLAEVVDVQRRTKKDDPSIKMLNWHLKIVEPAKYAGKNIYNNTTLVKESLWALRSFLVDLLGGEDKVPASSINIPLEKIVKAKKKIGITVADDEYNNKIKSKVVGTFTLADWKAREIQEDEAEEAEDADVKSAATSSDDDEDMDEIDVDDI